MRSGLAPDRGISLPGSLLPSRSTLFGWRIDEIERRMQMVRERGLCLGDIARQNQIGETLMCRDEFLAAVDTPHHHPAVAVRLIVEVTMRGQKPLGSACR